MTEDGEPGPSEVVAAPVDPRLGAEVGRYTIVRLIGRGGMGAVYEARHTRIGRRVAIKFLLPELAARPEILRRFENEAAAAGGLEHPNLGAVTDLGRGTDGAPYLVMELLKGDDCARLLERVGPLPAPRAVNIVLQACRGIAAAHDAGIIHRDIKPANLFVTDAGDGSDLVKVLDFGVAKLRPSDGEVATRTGSTLGTTHYMSPEQARGAGDVDPRTDVWSMGVVLYELLAGRKPYDGDDFLNIVHQILSAAPPRLDTLRPGLPAGLVAVVERAMQKDLPARFPTIRMLAERLAPFAGASPAPRPAASTTAVTAESPGAAAPRAEGRRAPRWRRVGTAFALVALAMVTIAVVGRRNAPPPPAVAAPLIAAPTPPAPAAPAPVAATDPPEPAPPSRTRSAKPPRARPVAAGASAGTGGTERPYNLDPNPY